MTIFKTTTLAAVTALVAVTACTDVNTQTTKPNQRTTEGVAIGAISGALIGGIAADSRKERQRNVVIGAIAGGALGGAIGNSLDKQAADLQAAIGDGRVSIVNTGNSLVVTMPQDILFDVDSARLRPDLKSDLRALAKNLQQYPNSRVQVIGHTDSTGDAGYNQQLSAQRASAVGGVLINNGVSAGRIVTVGRGESQPITTNQTPEGRAQNRRVEIVILPN
jgi:outer membrane protein OmpA-like peptidoglycan-associated protein